MKVKDYRAYLGYVNVPSHVVCFKKYFFVGKHDFHIQAIVIYKCLVVQHIEKLS